MLRRTMGGSSHIGAAAFADGYAELMEQCLQAGVQPQYVFYATGSGGTQAGLVAGHHLMGDSRSWWASPSATRVLNMRRPRADRQPGAGRLGSDARLSAADFSRSRLLPARL